MVGAAPLVPDRTICNPINDFKLGGVALIDTSLKFRCVRHVEPTVAKYSGWCFDPGWIHSEAKKRSVRQQHSHEPGPIIDHHSHHSSRSVLLSATNSSRLYRTTAEYYVDLLQTTVKRM